MSEYIEHSEIKKDKINIDSFNHKLKKRPVKYGSLGSLWLTLKFRFEKINKETAFGNKFSEIENLISPITTSVNELFSNHFDDTGEFSDVLKAMFIDGYNGRCQIRGSNYDHISANITTVVECFIFQLRFWNMKLERNGWKGRFSEKIMDFQSDLNKIVSQIPEPVEETILVKKRENRMNDNWDNNNDQEEEAEAEEENKNEEKDSYDKKNFKQIKIKVEPLVKNIENILRQANFLQKQSNEGEKNNSFKKYRFQEQNKNQQINRPFKPKVNENSKTQNKEDENWNKIPTKKDKIRIKQQKIYQKEEKIEKRKNMTNSKDDKPKNKNNRKENQEKKSSVKNEEDTDEFSEMFEEKQKVKEKEEKEGKLAPIPEENKWKSGPPIKEQHKNNKVEKEEDLEDEDIEEDEE